MKKTSLANRLLSMALCLCMVLSLMPAVAPVEAAAAEALTVTIDTGASVTLKDTDDDSFYEIGTADELYAFGALVNSGNPGINGVLTADIVINEGDVSGCNGIKQDGWRDWIGIGLNCDDNSVSYRGTFDGAKHTVSGVYYVKDAGNSVGFFDETGNEGIVKNLGIVNAYIEGGLNVGSVVGDTYGTVTGCWTDATVRGTDYVGGITGYINRDGIVTECYCMGSVSGGDSVGGIVGSILYGTVVRCYNTGSVFGEGDWVGGIVGEVRSSWSNESYTVTITDCYNIGTVSSNGSGKGSIIGSHRGDSMNFTNCYYLDGGLRDYYATAKADFTSGEVAYLLGEAFGQNIDNGKTNEGHPVLGGARVYQLPSDCGAAGIGYSNNKAGRITHAYQNGICTQTPGEIHYEPAVYGDHSAYQIGNAGQLFSFAELVNGGNYYVNAVLTADIDLEGRELPIICSTELYYDSTDYAESVYTGTFDGQGHVIRNYTVKGISDTKCSVGLFGTTKGATVKNLGVDSMTFDLNGATDVRAAAIVGQMLADTLIENCYVINSTLAPQNYIVGGVAGCNYGGTIRNCYTKNVTVTAHERCGNLVSDTCGDISGTEADRPGTVINCWTDAARVAGIRSGGLVTDCHENVTDAQFASGEVAYLLGDAWGQNLGSDAYPTLGSPKVYYGYTDCMDTEAEYSNAFLPARPEHRVEGGICTGCGASFEAAITHEGLTTYFEKLTSLSELAAKVAGGDTLRLFVDVTVDENETVAFAAYATLAVADGKSVTCNGTVTIGGEPGLIFENELYYYSEQQPDRDDGAFPTYWTAGEGYAIFKPATPVREAMLILHNATFRPSIYGQYEAAMEYAGALTVWFSGTNYLTGDNYYHGRVFYIQGDTTMIGVGENPVLNIQGGNDGAAVSAAWFGGNLTVQSGTVSFRGGNGFTSAGTSVRTLTVASGAVLNASGGRSEMAVSVGIGAGKIVAEGRVNALTLSEENLSSMIYTVYGDTTLEHDLQAVFEDVQDASFNLPADSSLTVDEGVTLDLSGMSVDAIDLSSTVMNNGTVKLPEGFQFVDRFTGGTVVTVDASVSKTYHWDAEKGSYICADELSHMGGNATCVSRPICELCGKEYGEKDATAHEQGTPATCQNMAVCGLCGESYGQTDPTVHDAAVDYVNGFCPNGCYEPAEQNESGFYEISNAGQLYWFADKVDRENIAYGFANAVLTDDITVNEGTVTASSTGLREWNPIGNYASNGNHKPYQGVFDGNGKTISGVYFNDNTAYSVGLFARISKHALVKNITLANSYFLGGMHTGGIVGRSRGVITGCINNATIESDANVGGGIVGYNEGTVELCGNAGPIKCSGGYGGGIAGSNHSVLRNCWNTASVRVEDDLVGGIVGYNTGELNNLALVENCWSIGEVSIGDGKAVGGVAGLSQNAGNVNCYSVMAPLGSIEDGVTQSQVTKKTLDQFASGEVAYLLGDAWGQSLGSDAYPTLGGDKVYYGYASCAADAQMVYTNDETASETKPGHTFGDNGFCEYCSVYESAVLNGDVYEISNAGQLMWFAEFVNAGNFTAGAVLTDNIDMNGLMWTPIGTETAYTGTFDGKGFAIKNLWQNSNGANGSRDGLVVTLGTGGAIMGVTVDNAAIWGASLYSTNGAGVIANRNHGTISGCVVKNSSVQQGAYEYLGGIAGENSGTIENCAVIGCSFTRRWGGTDAGSMGAITQTNNGTVKNCFSFGCAFNNGRADKAAIVAINNGTLDNCYYYTNSTVATTYGTAKTAEQFASGEVAYLLGEAFGQTVGTDDHPILGGKKVYYGYVSCADDAVMVYSNDPDANVTKPAHTLAEDDGDCTTGILCAACGDCMVQGKTAHDFVAGLTCGNDGCKVEATVSVSGNGGQEIRYATLKDAFAAVSSATAQDNTVVKLLADIDLDIYTYQITSGIFTLDLNGKTVTSAATWEAITVNGTGAMLTITDSGTGGTIRNMVGTAGTAVGVLEGTLVVSGGILTGRLDGVYVYGGRAEINGGTISGGTCGVDVGEATVTITGGVINGDSTDVDIYGGTVVISGGTFPGGISICYKTTLNAILAEGAAYWQDGKQLTVADDAIEITGGDVVVKPACVHNWVAATCVAPKTCSVCGTTEGEALGHSYKDDVCTVCGHIGVPVKLDSASLSFKEKIHYNIFFSLGLDENVDLSDMGLIMFDSLNADGTVDDAIAIHSGAVEVDGKYMIATDGVHAKRLGDTIYFRVYAKLADGSYVYSKTVQYSAVTYAEHILAGDQPESAKALVVAMLNYGAAAQQFFGYNTDDLVNAFLTEEQKALPEQYRDDMVSTVPVVAAEKQGSFANNKGFSKRMPAVSFEGAFEINYFFTPAYAPVDGITLYYWTEADFEANEVLTADNATGSIRLEGTGTEQYRGDIGGIAAKSLSENIYVAAIYSDGTTTHTSGVLGYSIGAYCASQTAKGSTLADLAMATAVYGYHAKQYFG